MKSLLLLACVIPLQPAPTPQESPDAELSRAALERWEQSAEKLRFDQPAYLWAWMDIDPDKAMQLVRRESFEQNAWSCVVEPLIARRDWKRVAKAAEFLDPATFSDRMWAAAAQVAGNHDDEEGIRFIEAQIKRFETLARSKDGSQDTTFQNARLCLAAAKLDILRKKRPDAKAKQKPQKADVGYAFTIGSFGLTDQGEAKLLRDMRIALAQQPHVAGNPLWRWQSFVGEDFLALESWVPQHMGGQFDQHRKQDLSLPLLKLAPNFSWVGHRLPQLDSKVVRPWIGRQLLRGRYKLTAAYLGRCNASLSVRAGLLAEIARELPESAKPLAAKFVATAGALFEKADGNAEHEQLLAAANLSLAYHTLGGENQSNAWLRKAFRTLEATKLEPISLVTARIAVLAKEESSEPADAADYKVTNSFQQWQQDYDNWAERLISEQEQPEQLTLSDSVMSAIAEAAVVNRIDRASLPKLLTDWVDNRSAAGADRLRVYRGGLTNQRYADISSLADPAKTPDAYTYPEHEKYNRLKAANQWAAAATQLQKLADGNPAWRTSYPDIARGSVRQIGLKRTLEWIAKIEDTEDRMRFEVHAVRAANPSGEPDRLPRLNGQPTSVLPGLNLAGLYGC